MKVSKSDIIDTLILTLLTITVFIGVGQWWRLQNTIQQERQQQYENQGNNK